MRPVIGGIGKDPGLDVRAVWGKKFKRTKAHPLICHAIDTAAVAELLLDVLVGPHCRAELLDGFAPLKDARGWVAALCGLHDLGKFSPAFQALQEELAITSLGESIAPSIRLLTQFKNVGRTDTPHGLLTAVHMRTMLEEWGAAGARGPPAVQRARWPSRILHQRQGRRRGGTQGQPSRRSTVEGMAGRFR